MCILKIKYRLIRVKTKCFKLTGRNLNEKTQRERLTHLIIAGKPKEKLQEAGLIFNLGLQSMHSCLELP